MKKKNELIYESNEVHSTVFIKLSNEHGIVFGEFIHPVYLPGEPEPDPDWKPANMQKKGSLGLRWITSYNDSFNNAKLVSDEDVRDYDLWSDLLKLLGTDQLIEYTFNEEWRT